MFRRGDITQEIGTGSTGDGSAYGGCNMVVTHCDIGHQRTEHIERRSFAYLFLELDVKLDLVERNMPRPFDDRLNTCRLGAVSQFSKGDEFFELAPVGCVGNASGPEAVAQA